MKKTLPKTRAEALYKAAGLDPTGKCFCALCQKTRSRELWQSMKRSLCVLALMSRN